MNAVYHGTGPGCLDGIIAKGIERRKRRYTPKPHCRKKAACVTTDRAIAELFAIRRTPSDDFMSGVVSGVVIEFELEGDYGVDYVAAVDPTSLQYESEFLVFSERALVPSAVWRSVRGIWVRDNRLVRARPVRAR